MKTTVPMTMNLVVTDEDIRLGGRTTLNNPITRALQRLTEKQWNIFDGNVAYELTAPHRMVRFPPDLHNVWTSYQSSGIMTPFEVELEVLRSQDLPGPKRRRGERRRLDRRSRERRTGERRNDSSPPA